jgi:hypothetical protein
MAVLIEAISVVIRTDALLEAFNNDWGQFKNTVPNATLCADGELVRLGFMTPEDAEHYVKRLEAQGLGHLEDGRTKNIVIVDQLRGPLAPCDWIEFGHISLDAGATQRVAACRLKGSTSPTLTKPDGWRFENSLSCSYGFTPTQSVGKALKFLRNENGLDVYWSELSGKEVYVGRPRREQP